MEEGEEVEGLYSEDEIKHALACCLEAKLSLDKGCALERLTVGQLIQLTSWLETSE
jgi:hypothetical protein